MAIAAKVESLLKVGFMRESHYRKWLLNVGLMKGYKMLSFMDAYLRYSQIKLCKNNQEKTSSHTRNSIVIG